MSVYESSALTIMSLRPRERRSISRDDVSPLPPSLDQEEFDVDCSTTFDPVNSIFLGRYASFNVWHRAPDFDGPAMHGRVVDTHAHAHSLLKQELGGSDLGCKFFGKICI